MASKLRSRQLFRIPSQSIAQLVLAAAVFAYLSIARTRGISRTFWLGSDQVLYWRMALASWHELPLGGGPSSMGGTTLGPVFIWLLWLIRLIIGPWTDNLPHAGGIGQAFLQSACDGLLFVAIWRKTASMPLALGLSLVIATAPYDMALTATIWNPPVAVGFVKLTSALILLSPEHSSRWWTAGACAVALLAVQAHSSAIFFAAPVVASFTVRELIVGHWKGALLCACTSIAAILLVETPFLADAAWHPQTERSPTIVVESLSVTLMHPGTVRILGASRALADACDFILFRPWAHGWLGWPLAFCAVMTAWRFRHDVLMLCVTVAPLLCAVVGFSLWQRPFEYYWFLTIAPSAALTMAFGLTAWRPATAIIGAFLLIVVVCAQPKRLSDALTINRFPEYGALVRGSRQLRRYTPEVAGIETDFVLHVSADSVAPLTEPEFVYRILGGRISSNALYIARIGVAGGVSLRSRDTEKVAADR